MEKDTDKIENRKKQNEFILFLVVKSKFRSSLIEVEDVPAQFLSVVKPYPTLLALEMSSMTVLSPWIDQSGKKTKPKVDELPPEPNAY